MNKINNRDNIVCYCDLDPIFIDKDNINAVRIIKDGVFQELQEETVVSSLTIRFPLHSASRIKVFYSYKPTRKHYIISLDSELIIIRKTKTLEFLQRIQRVSYYEIVDPQNLGIPKVMIHFKDNRTKLTDFSDYEFEIHETSALDLNIQSQISYLKASNKASQLLLQEKMKFILKANTGKAGDLIYPPGHEVNLEIKPLTFIKTGKPILKTHCNKWIIIFQISNVQEEPLTDFEVYGDYLVHSTYCYTHLSKITKLHPGESGHIAAVMDEPLFQPNIFTVDITLQFCASENLHQEYIGQMAVDISDIVSQKYSVTYENISDVLVLMSTGLKAELCLDKSCIEDFKDALTFNKFQQILDSAYVNTTVPYFVNCVIIYELKRKFCYVKLIIKEYNQLIVLLKNLNDFPNVKLENLPKNLYAKEALCTIKEELEFYKNVVFKKLEDNFDIQQEEIQQKIALNEIRSAASITNMYNF